MADAILHVKDGYYFEVPKALWRASYESLDDVPAFVLLAFPLVAYFAHLRTGTQGVAAAAVATVVCWLASTAALVVTSLFRGSRAVVGILVAMSLRTGVPLIMAILLAKSSRWLAEGGVFGAIVIFYLLTLIVETLLSLRFTDVARGVSKVS